MYCITRNEMKFGQFIVPKRTKCTVLNKLSSRTVDAPGVQVDVSILLWDMQQKKQCLVSEVQIKDEYTNKYNSSFFDGITVSTNTENLFMDAGDEFYSNCGLYDWQLEKIFGKNNVPEHLFLGKYEYNGADAKLSDVIEYLDEEFSKWVEENCEFYALTEEDIENGEGFDGAEPGDTTLSDKGLEAFYKKQLEYQNMLESTGFTYNFKGGLIWED